MVIDRNIEMKIKSFVENHLLTKPKGINKFINTRTGLPVKSDLKSTNKTLEIYYIDIDSNNIIVDYSRNINYLRSKHRVSKSNIYKVLIYPFGRSIVINKI